LKLRKTKMIFYPLLISLSLLFLAACGGNTSSQSSDTVGKAETAEEKPETKETIKVGMICGTMNPLLAVIGLNDGSFDNSGVEIEKVCFTSGSDAVQAMVGGSIDINIGSYEHVLRQRLHNLDVKAYAEIYNGLGYSLITKKDSPYKEVSDLKDTTLGVTKAGSLSDTGLKLILEEEGIDTQKDVEIVGGGAGATMLAAIEGGKVAAGMVPEPTSSQMMASGDYHLISDPSFDYAGIVIMAKTDWVNDHEESMKEFLKVLRDVRGNAETNTEKSVDALVKEFEKVPRKVLEASFKKEINKVPNDLIVTKESADAVVKSQQDLGTVSEEIPFEESVDLSLLPK
jgi:NitT/TauT family transport system substrate-binding protein